jgi:hypothetical protein
MDDMYITSPDWSQHLERLETVLKTLDLNNLSSQPTKTSLAFPSIKCLGFEVSKDGLNITEDKIKLIKALKPPHDKKISSESVWYLAFFSKMFTPSFLSRLITCASFLRRLLRLKEPSNARVNLTMLFKTDTSSYSATLERQ